MSLKIFQTLFHLENCSPHLKQRQKVKNENSACLSIKKPLICFLKRQNQSAMETVLYKLRFKYSIQKVKHSFPQQALHLDISNTASHIEELMIVLLAGKRTSICPLWKQYLHKLKR